MKRAELGLVAAALLVIASVGRADPIAGFATGAFTDPVGGPGMAVTGVGTSTFTWGTPAFGSPNSMTFTGDAFATVTEAVFSFGTLHYFNGSVLAGTEATSVDLDVTLTFTTPPGVVETFEFGFTMVNTPNTGDPVASADRVVLPSGFSATTFLLGGVPHTFEFVGFGSVLGGGGFTTTTEFNVFEQDGARAQLLGRVTANVPVPEPGTLALLGAAGVVGAAMRRRRRA